MLLPCLAGRLGQCGRADRQIEHFGDNCIFVDCVSGTSDEKSGNRIELHCDWDGCAGFAVKAKENGGSLDGEKI